MNTAAQTPLNDLIDLTGRTAVVTGGGNGIGQGIALRLAEAGAAVVIADIDLEAARATAASIGERAVGVRIDVSAESAGEDLVAAASEAFGGIDILVNNAGVGGHAPFVEMERSVVRASIDLNVTGTFTVSQAVARHMIERGTGGRIIMTSSIESIGPSVIGMSAYVASKHAVFGMVKSFALELAQYGISVNSVAPGMIATPGLGKTPDEALRPYAERVPAGRHGTPDDVGRAALFLASDLASYITGTQIVVDGGRILTGAVRLGAPESD